MRHRSSAFLGLLGAIALLGSTITPALAQGDQGGGDKLVTLVLGMQDSSGSPSNPAILDFAEQVRMASGGSIVVEPAYEAHGGGEFLEQVVAQRVVDGELDMGMVAGRAWNPVGVTSLQALQAPFLITDDNLATAVADSDIAQRALDGMAPAGVVGLALWPEDLRHPFSWVEPILTPTDFDGKHVRALVSTVTYDILRALGATPVAQFEDGVTLAAESGLRQGYTLPGTPTATGNITFFPKYDVLVVNTAVWEGLTEAQQTALREAAAITRQHAIEVHATDVEAGAAWCAAGGTVVLASDGQLAAFEPATASIYAQLEQDPLTKELIAAIRELKATTEPAPAAAACSPAAVEPTPAPVGPSPAPSVAPVAVLLPPDGVYRAEITEADFIAAGVPREDENVAFLAGVATWTIDGGVFSIAMDTGATTADDCFGTYAIVGDAVRFTFAERDACWGWDDFRVTRTSDGLEFTFVQCGHPYPGQCNADIDRAFMGRSWTKIK